MARPKRDTENERTFYRIRIIDAALGSITLGPFSEEDVEGLDQPKKFAELLAQDIAEFGLEHVMRNLGIWGPLTIHLHGDDGTVLPVGEIEL
jgi:hypothetical protein